jgi:hypothetical protein
VRLAVCPGRYNRPWYYMVGVAHVAADSAVHCLAHYSLGLV